MHSILERAKWLLFAFAALSPIATAFSQFGQARAEPEGPLILIVGAIMSVLAIYPLSRLFRFPEIELGWFTQRHAMSAVAVSFVITSAVAYLKMTLEGSLYWHEHSIVFGLAAMWGCSIAIAVELNKRRTRRYRQP